MFFSLLTLRIISKQICNHGEDFRGKSAQSDKRG